MRKWIPAALAATGAYLFAVSPRIKDRPEPMPKVYYAHRGLHDNISDAPENTMAAFAKAVKGGYGIELDVQLTKDGQVVVVHDFNLKRICGIDGDVDSFTYEELQKFPVYESRQTIPLFSDVLALVNGRVPLIVEIKYKGTGKAVCEKTWELLKHYSGVYCIESFHPGIILWLKKHRPDICRGQLSQNFWRHRGELKGWQAFAMTNLLSNFLTRPDFISFHWAHRMLPAVWLCRRLHRLPVFCWTVQSRQTMEQVEREGCLVIFEGFLPAGRPVPAVPKAS